MAAERKVRKVKTPRTKRFVKEFLERDDNSRVKAEKRSTITKKGEKRQIRLLCDDLKTLHRKFLAETKHKISYSLFCFFKPFYIVKPTYKDRETCLCKTHENLHFKMNRCFQENIIKTNDVDNVLKNVTCNIEDKGCMYRECDGCKDKNITIGEGVESEKQTWWFEWKNRRIEREKQKNGQVVSSMVSVTVKEKEFGSLQILSEELNKDLQKATRHIFNIRHQYKTIRCLRESLTDNEMMMQIDFSENYNCKYASEIQSMHFGASQRQISLHTGVAYTKNGVHSFCTVSDCLKHGPAAIWAHLQPVIEELRAKTQVTKIHFISDGPTTQYRNKLNFFLFSTKIFEFGFSEASWNLLEAGHGKGAADGIGAVVKRTADAFVNKGGDINDASGLINALTSAGTSVSLHHISEDAIEAVEATLPTTLKPLHKTMQIHQVLVNKPGEVKHRVLSCFCKRPASCDCYDILTTDFPIEPVPTEVNSAPVTTVASDTGDTTAGLPNEPAPAEVPSQPVTSGTGDSTAATPKKAGRNVTPEKTLDTSADIQHTTNARLVKVNVVDNSIMHKYCVVKYDDQVYPGIIHDIDDDEEIEVQVMHRIGRNRFFWPLMEDILWYPKANIVTMLADSPKLVTKRHHEIEPKIWALLEKEFC